MLGAEGHETHFHTLPAAERGSISPLSESPSPQTPEIDFFPFLPTHEFGRYIFVVQSRTGCVRLCLVGRGREGENRLCKKSILYKDLLYDTSTGH